MKLDFSSLLHFLFPLSEDEALIETCSVADFSNKLSTIQFEGIHALASFKDAQVRAALHLVKFHNNAHARVLLAALCETYFKTLPQQEWLLLPIPLSVQRHRTRGHNQSETIASAALRTLPHIQMRTDILVKTKDTPSQTTLSRNERLRNLEHAFALQAHKTKDVRGKDIILFDDVTTTGATLSYAKKVLQLHEPASITCVAIAH